ncbi:MAG TPA: hypothetical protein VLL52_25495, partial [Anaerolineae bacterium]|nr:hypothetical protein [Anaerolineae bacterium]
ATRPSPAYPLPPSHPVMTWHCAPYIPPQRLTLLSHNAASPIISPSSSSPLGLPPLSPPSSPY